MNEDEPDEKSNKKIKKVTAQGTEDNEETEYIIVTKMNELNNDKPNRRGEKKSDAD